MRNEEILPFFQLLSLKNLNTGGFQFGKILERKNRVYVP